jgi:ribonuclease P/MRP protein subunit RPP1
MYEAVHAHPDPDGAATPARFAATAARYGYRGLVVRATGPAPTGPEPADGTDEDASYRPPTYAAVAAEYDIDVVDAVEVRADDPGSASGAVGNYRRDRTLVLVRGGTTGLNRFAAEQDRVDVLTHPFGTSGTAADVNHVVVKAARDHGVRIEFALGPVLRASGGQRVRALRKLRKLREIVSHYDAPFVVSGAPSSHLQLRAPRELAAVGEAIGLGTDRVTAGLREWGRLAARNRDRQSDTYVEPGVRRGRADANDGSDVGFRTRDPAEDGN